MKLVAVLSDDLKANTGRPHIQSYLLLHRLAAACRSSGHPVSTLAGLPLAAVARSYGLFALGIDIPLRTRIGSGLAVHHGMGLVIHADSVVGRSVTLRHSTTLGDRGGRAPVIEDGADIGPGVVILGPAVVGAKSTVGAGSVVIHDVPSGGVVAGNPAKGLQSTKEPTL